MNTTCWLFLRKSRDPRLPPAAPEGISCTYSNRDIVSIKYKNEVKKRTRFDDY